jgi:galactosylceramidase
MILKSLAIAGAVIASLPPILHFGSAVPGQTAVISLNGNAGGDRFDGIGAVSGGGATTVLLKDYPAKQRDQILDLLFKPNFGASISALYVEVPGDGNSTQGSEPSHMHSPSDENYFRGYEWWLMKEAKKRNPSITLDGAAWGCPGWVGNGDFWSQDMCDYYAKWIKGLKTIHGLDMDAIGCRNERGDNERFIKMFKKTLNAAGLTSVKVHGFDNWGAHKFDWCKDLLTDPELAASVDAISNHTMTDVGTPESVKKLAKELHKPIWNSEEHVYKDGFDCEISIVQAFNQNYVRDGVTKITNWYLVGSVYDTEPYPVQPAMLIANSPWSGAYTVREALWGYAHYGQFCKVGWDYLNGGCGNLPEKGTYVTLKSPGTDYSVIAETKGATREQTLTFNVGPGLSKGSLCVWRSNRSEQFVRLPDISPVNGAFSITMDPNSVYSLSTTRGQRKGAYPVPAAKPFPFPYYETFDHYGDPKSWGYLPHYTADISGVFELAKRPDGSGSCLRQVIDKKAQSWAPEWMPYTVLGDSTWRDYEVCVDVLLDEPGWAGVMGHVINTGNGWYGAPKGYYMRLDSEGSVSLYAALQNERNPAGELLAKGIVPGFDPKAWHKLKLQFIGAQIVGIVDGATVVKAQGHVSANGMVGLVTGGIGNRRNSACFDNLTVNPVNGPKLSPTRFPQDRSPLYK